MARMNTWEPTTQRSNIGIEIMNHHIRCCHEYQVMSKSAVTLKSAISIIIFEYLPSSICVHWNNESAESVRVG